MQTVPLLKIESDYTMQSSGQLLTRLEAFAESIQRIWSRHGRRQETERWEKDILQELTAVPPVQMW